MVNVTPLIQRGEIDALYAAQAIGLQPSTCRDDALLPLATDDTLAVNPATSLALLSLLRRPYPTQVAGEIPWPCLLGSLNKP